MIIKGDDLVKLLTIRPKDGQVISMDKIEVYVNNVLLHTEENPVFPLDVNVSRDVSSTFKYSNTVHLVKYTNDVKTTGLGYGKFKAKTSPVENSVCEVSPTFEVSFCEGEQIIFDVTFLENSGGGGGGTSDHSKLTNRGAASQHPISAITDLQEKLDAKVEDANYVHTDNNFTTVEKEKLSSLNNYNDSDVRQLIGGNSQEIADLDLIKADRSEIPSITGLATEGYVNTAVSGKQDTLIAGANITITNNVISASSGGGSVDAVWGSITGTLSNQSDLKIALDGKQAIGDYALSSELPTKTSDLTNDSGFLTSIPSDVVRDSDLATVATSGSYNDLSDKPVIPTDTVTSAQLQAVADSIPDTSGLATKTELSAKVDKIEGKGLSTNDFTTAEKTKLAGLENYDDTSLVAQIQTKQDKTEKITISKADAEGGYAFLDNKDYVVSEGISTLVISSATGAGSIRFATLSGFALDVGSLKIVGEHTFEENTQYDIAYIDGWVYVSQGVAI